MSTAISLDSFKTMAILLQELGLSKPGPNCPCPKCGSGDALSVQLGESGAYCRCHSCGLKGDVFSVRSILCNISIGDSIKSLSGGKVPLKSLEPIVRQKPATPQLLRNIDAEAQLARQWAEDLEHAEDALDFLWTTRGISASVASTYMLGIKDIKRDSIGAIIGATWTIPVLSHALNRPLIGIKCHVQPKPASGMKNYWIPRGVKQTHYLFPLPECQNLTKHSQIILAAGELKALAFLSIERAATARTTGEQANWPAEVAERFRGLRVTIDPDREESDTAKAFVLKSSTALRNIAALVEVFQNV